MTAWEAMQWALAFIIFVAGVGLAIAIVILTVEVLREWRP